MTSQFTLPKTTDEAVARLASDVVNAALEFSAKQIDFAIDNTVAREDLVHLLRHHQAGLRRKVVLK